MTAASAGTLTVDAFLGGRVEAVQPADGRHRSGLEAVLLSAAIDSRFGGTLVDFGAGAGVAGMCVAARCSRARIVLVDRDEDAVACASSALARPANRPFADRIEIVTTDVAAPEADRAAAGLVRAFADAVIMNPPFHDAREGTVSPVSGRASAHVLADGGLDPWFRAAASVLKPDGRLVVVFRADGLDAVLAALAGRFGGAAILPVHPRSDLPAHRVLVRAAKGSRARPAILPALTLHGEAGGAYLPSVEAILRDGAGLAEVLPAWPE